MGVGQIAVQWFNSYLSGRQQLVNIADTKSDHFRNVLCGVPQGSILGLLLFLVYVNDMKAAVKCKLLLYADDSALLVSGKQGWGQIQYLYLVLVLKYIFIST